jgi:hypothetical protein
LKKVQNVKVGLSIQINWQNENSIFNYKVSHTYHIVLGIRNYCRLAVAGYGQTVLSA